VGAAGWYVLMLMPVRQQGAACCLHQEVHVPLHSQHMPNMLHFAFLCSIALAGYVAETVQWTTALWRLVNICIGGLGACLHSIYIACHWLVQLCSQQPATVASRKLCYLSRALPMHEAPAGLLSDLAATCTIKVNPGPAACGRHWAGHGSFGAHLPHHHQGGHAPPRAGGLLELCTLRLELHACGCVRPGMRGWYQNPFFTENGVDKQ